MGARALVRYLDPRGDGLSIQVRFDFQQEHELLQEMLDGINALRERGGGRRFRDVRAVFHWGLHENEYLN
ncbi:hypothetical protein D3C87_1761280 [compost metagenome]